MKTSKKLLAFLLSAVMVLSLVVSVSVVASADTSGNELYRFEVTEDSTEQSVGSYLTEAFYDKTAGSFNAKNLTQEIATDAVYGNVWHATLDKKSGLANKGSGLDANNNQTMADSQGVTEVIRKDKIVYKVGNKYSVKFRAKATKSTQIQFFFFIGGSRKITYVGGTSTAQYPKRKQTLTDEWADYEVSYTITGMTNTAGTTSYQEYTDGQLRFELVGAAKDSEIWVDSIIFTEYEAASGSAVFTIDEGVTVKSGNLIVESGSPAKEAYYGAGIPKTFTATVSDSGKSATVYVDDKKWVSGTDTFEFTIPEDAETVRVQLNDEKIIYSRYYNSDSDNNFSRHEFSNLTYTDEDGKKQYYVNSSIENGCLKLAVADAQAISKYAPAKYPTASYGFCKLTTNMTMYAGHEYAVRYKIKTSESVNVKMGNGSKLLSNEYVVVYPKPANGVNTKTDDFSTITWDWLYAGKYSSSQFAVDQKMTNPTLVFYPAFGSSKLNGGEVIWFDELEIVDKGMVLDTVTARIDSEGGTLKRETKYSTTDPVSYKVLDGAPAYGSATSGQNLKFTVTPDEGKVAVVRYYDVLKTYDTETDFEVAVDGDTTLDVTFVDATKTAAVEKTTMLRTADNAVYVYSLVNQFNPALDANQNLNFGIKLWNAINTDGFVILNAKADNDGNDAVAQFGQAFVIKAYGEAITADNTYEAQAFVGTEYGDVVSTATEEN